MATQQQPTAPIELAGTPVPFKVERHTVQHAPEQELRSGSLRRPLLLLIFASVVLPNLPFWIVAPQAPRALFNVDYVLVLVVALLGFRTLFLVSFAALFIFDALQTAAWFYYFSQPDWIFAIRYLRRVSPTRVYREGAELLIIAFLLSTAAWTMVRGWRKRSRRPAYLSLALLCAVLSLAAVGTGAAGQDSYSYSMRRVANSSIFRFVNQLHRLSAAATPAEFAVAPSASALSRILVKGVNQAAAMQRPRNIVLIVVESFGLAHDKATAGALESPLLTDNVRGRFTVETGSTPFHGSTVPGELRELCGVQAGIRDTTSIARLAPTCLPDILKKRGYETSAYHGFTGEMFDRVGWYPGIGFDHVYFLEQLKARGNLKECGGPFPGICDTDMAKSIGSALNSAKRPQFIFWMTLSSHLPVETSKAILREQDCERPARQEDQAMCVWQGLIRRVMASVAALSTTPAARDTEFVIVGDHAPPFVSAKNREQFSTTEVPYIHLIPRAGSTAGDLLQSGLIAKR